MFRTVALAAVIASIAGQAVAGTPKIDAHCADYRNLALTVEQFDNAVRCSTSAYAAMTQITRGKPEKANQLLDVSRGHSIAPLDLEIWNIQPGS